MTSYSQQIASFWQHSSIQWPLFAQKHVVTTLLRRPPYWIYLDHRFVTCQTIRSAGTSLSISRISRINRIDPANGTHPWTPFIALWVFPSWCTCTYLNIHPTFCYMFYHHHTYCILSDRFCHIVLLCILDIPKMNCIGCIHLDTFKFVHRSLGKCPMGMYCNFPTSTHLIHHQRKITGICLCNIARNIPVYTCFSRISHWTWRRRHFHRS